MPVWWPKRGPSKLERVLAGHDAIEADIKRRDGAQDPAPFADQCKKVRTSHGEAAHYQHPDLGVICDELHDWPGEWFPAPDSMPVHGRCQRAARAVDGGGTA